jgi:hypothetical protein
MSTSVAFNNTGSQGDSDSLAVERALRTLHAAGYQIPDKLRYSITIGVHLFRWTGAVRRLEG